MIRKVIGFLIYILVKLWVKTLRFEIKGDFIPGERYIFGFLHGEQFPLIGFPRDGLKVVALVSTSKDGRLQAEVYRRAGFEIVYGSSSKWGSRALLGLLKKIKEQFSIAVTVDGPKGPRGIIKPGIFFLSLKTSLPILLIKVIFSKAITLKKSWDLFKIPLPFSKVTFYTVKIDRSYVIERMMRDKVKFDYIVERGVC